MQDKLFVDILPLDRYVPDIIFPLAFEWDTSGKTLQGLMDRNYILEDPQLLFNHINDTSSTLKLNVGLRLYLDYLIRNPDYVESPENCETLCRVLENTPLDMDAVGLIRRLNLSITPNMILNLGTTSSSYIETLTEEELAPYLAQLFALFTPDTPKTCVDALIEKGFNVDFQTLTQKSQFSSVSDDVYFSLFFHFFSEYKRDTLDLSLNALLANIVSEITVPFDHYAYCFRRGLERSCKNAYIQQTGNEELTEYQHNLISQELLEPEKRAFIFSILPAHEEDSLFRQIPFEPSLILDMVSTYSLEELSGFPSYVLKGGDVLLLRLSVEKGQEETEKLLRFFSVLESPEAYSLQEMYSRYLKSLDPSISFYFSFLSFALNNSFEDSFKIAIVTPNWSAAEHSPGWLSQCPEPLLLDFFEATYLQPSQTTLQKAVALKIPQTILLSLFIQFISREAGQPLSVEDSFTYFFAHTPLDSIECRALFDLGLERSNISCILANFDDLDIVSKQLDPVLDLLMRDLSIPDWQSLLQAKFLQQSYLTFKVCSDPNYAKIHFFVRQLMSKLKFDENDTFGQQLRHYFQAYFHSPLDIVLNRVPFPDSLDDAQLTMCKAGLYKNLLSLMPELYAKKDTRTLLAIYAWFDDVFLLSSLDLNRPKVEHPKLVAKRLQPDTNLYQRLSEVPPTSVAMSYSAYSNLYPVSPLSEQQITEWKAHVNISFETVSLLELVSVMELTLSRNLGDRFSTYVVVDPKEGSENLSLGVALECYSRKVRYIQNALSSSNVEISTQEKAAHLKKGLLDLMCYIHYYPEKTDTFIAKLLGVSNTEVCTDGFCQRPTDTYDDFVSGTGIKKAVEYTTNQTLSALRSKLRCAGHGQGVHVDFDTNLIAFYYGLTKELAPDIDRAGALRRSSVPFVQTCLKKLIPMYFSGEAILNSYTNSLVDQHLAQFNKESVTKLIEKLELVVWDYNLFGNRDYFQFQRTVNELLEPFELPVNYIIELDDYDCKATLKKDGVELLGAIFMADSSVAVSFNAFEQLLQDLELHFQPALFLDFINLEQAHIQPDENGCYNETNKGFLLALKHIIGDVRDILNLVKHNYLLSREDADVNVVEGHQFYSSNPRESLKLHYSTLYKLSDFQLIDSLYSIDIEQGNISNETVQENVMSYYRRYILKLMKESFKKEAITQYPDLFITDHSDQELGILNLGAYGLHFLKREQDRHAKDLAKKLLSLRHSLREDNIHVFEETKTTDPARLFSWSNLTEARMLGFQLDLVLPGYVSGDQLSCFELVKKRDPRILDILYKIIGD